MTNRTSICVQYKYADGWHVFTSDEVQGLYVASKCPDVAYMDVALSIKKLLKLNENIDCEIVPEITFSEFLARVRTNSAKSSYATWLPKM